MKKNLVNRDNMVNRIKEAVNSNMKWKFFSLLLRFVLLVVVAILYFMDSNIIEYPVNFFDSLLPLHFIWLFFVVFFLVRLCKKNKGIMAGKRRFAQYNEIVSDYNKEKLKIFVKKNNRRMIWVLAVALIVNIPQWILYHYGIIDEKFLTMIFVLYFSLDIACETVFCPFQRIFLRNKCCHDCRIYSWNSILTVAPLMIIPGFFSWSLISIALIDLIYFEIMFYRHPEYFWEGSNVSLRCINCTKKMCVVRGKVV